MQFFFKDDRLPLFLEKGKKKKICSWKKPSESLTATEPRVHRQEAFLHSPPPQTLMTALRAHTVEDTQDLSLARPAPNQPRTFPHPLTPACLRNDEQPKPTVRSPVGC